MEACTLRIRPSCSSTHRAHSITAASQLKSSLSGRKDREDSALKFVRPHCRTLAGWREQPQAQQLLIWLAVAIIGLDIERAKRAAEAGADASGSLQQVDVALGAAGGRAAAKAAKAAAAKLSCKPQQPKDKVALTERLRQVSAIFAALVIALCGLFKATLINLVFVLAGSVLFIPGL